MLNKAKELGITLSVTLEYALIEAVEQIQRMQGLEENRNSINAYNEHVDSNGVFSDDVRSF